MRSSASEDRRSDQSRTRSRVPMICQLSVSGATLHCLRNTRHRNRFVYTVSTVLGTHSSVMFIMAAEGKAISPIFNC